MYARGQPLVLPLSEALHDVAQLQGAATVDLFQGTLHEHGIESTGDALGLELVRGPLHLTDLLQGQQVKGLVSRSFDRPPNRLRVVLVLKGQVKGKLDESVMVQVRDYIQ